MPEESLAPFPEPDRKTVLPFRTDASACTDNPEQLLSLAIEDRVHGLVRVH